MVLPKMFAFCAVSFLGSPIALAYDFSAANALFGERAQGAQKIAQARSAYDASLATAVSSEKIFAGEQIARLYYYEGITTPDADTEARKAIYTRCMKSADDNLTADKVGANVQYYYWKASCLASWGKAAGSTSPASLARVPELLGLIKDGLAISDKYEGGGFYRLSAAVYLKIPAIFGGGKEKSLEFADKAIKSEPFPGSVDPDTASGDYFYNIYEYKAEALSKLGRTPEAVDMLNAVIHRIEGGDIPVGREPETKVFLQDLKAELAKIQ